MRENHRRNHTKNTRTQKEIKNKSSLPKIFRKNRPLEEENFAKKRQRTRTRPKKKHKKEKRTAFPPSTKGRASEKLCDRTCPIPSERICVTIRLPPPFPLPAPPLGDCGREWGEHRQLRTVCPGRCPMLFPNPKNNHHHNGGRRLVGHPRLIYNMCLQAGATYPKERERENRERERERATPTTNTEKDKNKASGRYALM